MVQAVRAPVGWPAPDRRCWPENGRRAFDLEVLQVLLQAPPTLLRALVPDRSPATRQRWSPLPSLPKRCPYRGDSQRIAQGGARPGHHSRHPAQHALESCSGGRGGGCRPGRGGRPGSERRGGLRLGRAAAAAVAASCPFASISSGAAVYAPIASGAAAYASIACAATATASTASIAAQRSSHDGAEPARVPAQNLPPRTRCTQQRARAGGGPGLWSRVRPRLIRAQI